MADGTVSPSESPPPLYLYVLERVPPKARASAPSAAVADVHSPPPPPAHFAVGATRDVAGRLNVYNREAATRGKPWRVRALVHVAPQRRIAVRRLVRHLRDTPSSLPLLERVYRADATLRLAHTRGALDSAPRTFEGVDFTRSGASAPPPAAGTARAERRRQQVARALRVALAP